MRPHEKGVRVSGGWIAGTLDLEGCRIPRDIGLKDCRFEAPPALRSAVIDSLFLDGSFLPGLQADRLEARGDVTLRGATVRGQVELAGARIGGWFEADGATLEAPGGIVLSAPGASAQGIHLRGATLRGGIDLEGVRLVAALEAQGMALDHPDAVALEADSLETGSNVILRRARIFGSVVLTGRTSVATSTRSARPSSPPAGRPSSSGAPTSRVASSCARERASRGCST